MSNTITTQHGQLISLEYHASTIVLTLQDRSYGVLAQVGMTPIEFYDLCDGLLDEYEFGLDNQHEVD